MKTKINNGFLSLRMTDEEAAELIQKLQGVLGRRKAIIAAAPDAELEMWQDMVMSGPGLIGEEAAQISISICAV